MRTKATKTDKKQKKAVGFMDIRNGGEVTVITTEVDNLPANNIACCPSVDNVGGWDQVKEKHRDWELSECPVCRKQIWISTEAMWYIKKGGRYACSTCALREKGGVFRDLERIRRGGSQNG